MILKVRLTRRALRRLDEIEAYMRLINEAGLRVWDRHPYLVVHQGVEVVVAGIHLGRF
jgi:hypothetical protein